MRLFLAVWPTEPVLAALRALPRPEVDRVHWLAEPNWHATLLFLGEVDDERAPAFVQSLRYVHAAACAAEIGGEMTLMGRNSLVVPVRGMDALAQSVRSAVMGGGGRMSQFSGHVTVARSRDAAALRRLRSSVDVVPWQVDSFSLVRSHLSQQGSTYETLVDVSLTFGR